MGASYGNMTSFMQQFTPMAGGRTGEFALDFGAAQARTIQQGAGYDPMRTVGLNSVVSRLHSVDDLRTLIDQNDHGAFTHIDADPVGHQMLLDFQAADKSGTPLGNLTKLRIFSELVGGKAGTSMPPLPGTAEYVNRNNIVVSGARADTPTGRMLRAGYSGSSYAGQVAADQTGVRKNVAAALDRASASTGVPRALLAAIAGQESGFNPNLTSAKGAMGLMQIMPGTAAHVGLALRDAYDPEKNAMGGAAYIKELLGRYHGDVYEALEAYNWGPGKSKGVDHDAAILSGNAPLSVRNYASATMARMAAESDRDHMGVTGNFDSDLDNMLRTRANVASAGLVSAYISSREAGAIIPAVNSAITSVAKAAGDFATAMGNAARAVQQSNSATGVPGNSSVPVH
jgi:hypothetical protein